MIVNRKQICHLIACVVTAVALALSEHDKLQDQNVHQIFLLVYPQRITSVEHYISLILLRYH